MLCQFTVKNFKSIRDEMTFDMQAAAISEHEDRIIKDRDGEVFLPVSAVYGPNGGGKSNVLEALHSLVLKVLRPLYATSDIEKRSDPDQENTDRAVCIFRRNCKCVNGV